MKGAVNFVATRPHATNGKFQRRSLAERFWEKVDKDGPIPEERPELGHCWLWLGAVFKDGYGNVYVDEKHNRAAHIVGYQLQVSDVAEGKVLDHLCRTRRCVRGNHLEPVTKRVNTLRGTGPSAAAAQATHCPQGHPYDLLNTRFWRGHRYCRACQRRKESK